MLAQGYAVKRALDPTSPGGVNFKNAFAPSDSQTPLQFLYEAANCRFFYTPEMITSAELTWRYAVNATWTDPATYCVEGSMVPVNTSRTVDPAFQNLPVANTGSSGTNETDGTDDNDGTDGTDGTDGSNGSNGDSGDNANNGTSGDDGNSGSANATSSNADDKKNAARGVVEHSNLQVAGLLAALSIMMLCL